VPVLNNRTRLVIGQVRGIHGLRGHVRLEVLTDRPEERFAVGRVAYLEGSRAPLTIAEAAPVEDGPGWRVRFDEIPDRTAAEPLRGAYLEMEVDPSAELEAGEVYWHQVVGAEVLGQDGRSLGKVEDVYRAGEREVYVVRGDAVGSFDLPAVKGLITEFAPERGRIVVDEAALGLTADEHARAPRAARPRRWSRHGKGARLEATSKPAAEADEPGTAEEPRTDVEP